ncbi:hypothetical protein HY637_03535 [Candidatus Woesearchaeota archaeon]|nr:hypothetical protein [Candidatus Woesearchaeota archaeon]
MHSTNFDVIVSKQLKYKNSSEIYKKQNQTGFFFDIYSAGSLNYYFLFVIELFANQIKTKKSDFRND